MERLNGEYIRGYTKALLDIKNFFENHSNVLKSCRLYNAKGIANLLNALIDHREELRETGDANLTYSTAKGAFIICDQKLNTNKENSNEQNFNQDH